MYIKVLLAAYFVILIMSVFYVPHDELHAGTATRVSCECSRNMCFVMPVQKDLTGQPLRELLSESCVSLCLIR